MSSLPTPPDTSTLAANLVQLSRSLAVQPHTIGARQCLTQSVAARHLSMGQQTYHMGIRQQVISCYKWKLTKITQQLDILWGYLQTVKYTLVECNVLICPFHDCLQTLQLNLFLKDLRYSNSTGFRESEFGILSTTINRLGIPLHLPRCLQAQQTSYLQCHGLRKGAFSCQAVSCFWLRLLNRGWCPSTLLHWASQL